ncbi:HNH endonuclease signature motif containing protein [Streptomyces yanii]|uniref:HNH endonuclease signature motif containing protein n=1 Tax=Streptomyces yanii TaxID=78510 RepID=A0ABV5R7A4_9ACTN
MHFRPWSNGGLDGLANLVPACASCNKKKGDKTPPAWWISMQLPWFYGGYRSRATPQGDENTRSLRERYLELHEETLGVLDNLDEVAAEIADPARTSWFRKSFARVEYQWGVPATVGEKVRLCRRKYADEIAAAREAGWPELKRARVRFIYRWGD